MIGRSSGFLFAAYGRSLSDRAIASSGLLPELLLESASEGISLVFEAERNGHGKDNDTRNRASCRHSLGDADLDLLLDFDERDNRPSTEPSLSFLEADRSSDRRNGPNIMRFVFTKTFLETELSLRVHSVP